MNHLVGIKPGKYKVMIILIILTLSFFLSGCTTNKSETSSTVSAAESEPANTPIYNNASGFLIPQDGSEVTPEIINILENRLNGFEANKSISSYEIGELDDGWLFVFVGYNYSEDPDPKALFEKICNGTESDAFKFNIQFDPVTYEGSSYGFDDMMSQFNEALKPGMPPGIVAISFEEVLYKVKTINLMLIDPISGSVEPWKSFNATENSSFQIYQPTAYEAQRLFSPDYEKAAITIFNPNDSSFHVGWVTSDGVITDVSSIVSESNNEFSDKIINNQVGRFDANGMFYYMNMQGSHVMMVDPNKLEAGAAKEIDVYCDAYGRGYRISPNGASNYDYENKETGAFAYGKIEDLIDDMTVLVRGNSDSDKYQFRVSTAYTNTDQVPESFRGPGTDINQRNLLPENDRMNWNAVSSPDGKQVAFLSQHSNGNERPKLFIISSDGEEPVSVNSNYEFYRWDGSANINNCLQLLDWFE